MGTNKFFVIALTGLLASSATFCSEKKKPEHPKRPPSPRTLAEIKTELKKIYSEEKASRVIEALVFAHHPNNPFPGFGSMLLFSSAHNHSQNMKLTSRLNLSQKNEPSKKEEEEKKE